jgi:hypothetical protein
VCAFVVFLGAEEGTGHSSPPVADAFPGWIGWEREPSTM